MSPSDNIREGSDSNCLFYLHVLRSRGISLDNHVVDKQSCSNLTPAPMLRIQFPRLTEDFQTTPHFNQHLNYVLAIIDNKLTVRNTS